MQPQAAQSPNLFHESIERTQKAIYYMSAFLVILLIIFCEISCLVRSVCHTSEDIDIPPYASHIFLPSMVICLVMTILAYEAAEYAFIEVLRPLRIFILIWCLLLIILSVAEWIAGMVLSGASDRSDTWNSLTPLSKAYYDDDKDKLDEDYRINMSIVCLFQIVIGVILLAIGIAVWVLFRKIPSGYLPRPKYEKLKDVPVNQTNNPSNSPGPVFVQENPAQGQNEIPYENPLQYRSRFEERGYPTPPREEYDEYYQRDNPLEPTYQNPNYENY